MELRLIFTVITVIMIVLIAITPKMIRLRIAIFRKFKWNGLAMFHEKHFDQLVIAVRVIWALIIAIVVFLFLRA